MKKLISLLLALLLLTFSLVACGSDEKKATDEHDPALIGYWISDKHVSVQGKETTNEDVSGEMGIEIYENGMIRIMERGIDAEKNLCYYTAEERYSDYMIIDKNQIAFLKQGSNGSLYIDTIFEYTVKNGVLTLVRYGVDSKIAMTYKRLETPFYKYFPNAPADLSSGDMSENVVPDEK